MIIGISGKKKHGKDTLALIIQWLVFVDRIAGKNTGNNNSGWTYEKFIAENDEKKAYLTTSEISGWHKKMFAEKLKEIVCLLIGCTMSQLEDINFKERELGEEWKVYYWAHYKASSSGNKQGRISGLYFTKEEALAVTILGKAVTEYFGTASRIESYILTPRLMLQYIGTDCGRKIVHPNIWVNALMKDYKLDTPKRQSTELPNWIITDVRFLNEIVAIKQREGLVFRINRPSIVSTDTHESETALDDYLDFDHIFTNDSTIEKLIHRTTSVLQSYKIIQ